MDTETAFDLLKHEYRRAIVGVLHETRRLSRPELTARIATRVAEDENALSDSRTRRRIRIRLHHNHLPKLADAGVLEYDDETIAATPELETVVAYLEDYQRDALATPDSIGEQLAQFYA